MNYDVPPFDPLRNPGSSGYYPANDASQRLMRIQYAYLDIASLFRIAGACSEEIDRRLLLKYVVVEWLSLDRELCDFVQRVSRGRIDYPVSEATLAAVHDSYAEYRAVRFKHHESLKLIRNKIGAHRDPMDPFAISVIWESLAPEKILEVLKPIPALVSLLRGLDIYQWTLEESTEEGRVVAFIGPYAVRDTSAGEARR